MQRLFRSGAGFVLLALAFMVIALSAEKPAVFISIGALWLIIGFAMAAKNSKRTESDEPGDPA